jgi:hypothetical protein
MKTFTGCWRMTRASAARWHNAAPRLMNSGSPAAAWVRGDEVPMSDSQVIATVIGGFHRRVRYDDARGRAIRIFANE